MVEITPAEWWPRSVLSVLDMSARGRCRINILVLEVTILSSFESRLVQLENAIIPVHTQTENLQRLQDHVDRTLSCLDHVIDYYHVAADTEETIREGSVRGRGLCGYRPVVFLQTAGVTVTFNQGPHFSAGPGLKRSV